MSKSITQIKLAVSCPGDVDEDVSAIQDAVDEINQTWGNQHDFHVNLVHWQQNVVPDIAEYPQQVINEQLFEDVDIYVGLMGTRFGSPTSAAESGTEEEFLLAYEKAQDDKDSTSVLFYFRQSGQLFSADLNQMAQVRGFRHKMTEEGVLYGTYTDADDLAKNIRLHLPKHICKICKL